MTQLIAYTPTSVETLDTDPPAPSVARMADAAPAGAVLRASRRVPVVLVERDDGSCVLYGRGQIGEWPSMDDAWRALEQKAPRLVWRESTAGVWVGRPDRNERPTVDRGSRPTRRVEATPADKPSPNGDTYMTARVIRGLSLTS
jgi:hypothetical protein